ncbi:MAG: zinc-dependent peptidase [Chitinophagaceae bacterium]|nr:zinc-dependent peptidase [Chitinophagaceae bacterium]
MDAILFSVLILSSTAVLFVLLFRQKKKRPVLLNRSLPEPLKKILLEEVPFYHQLGEDGRRNFEARVQVFLDQVRITGVNTTVEDMDRVLVASSAIIPIFNFEDWQYVNLHEVLLYPDSFDHEFEQQGSGRNILGMVGEGALNHMMILSQQELRQSFSDKTGKNNTAIHEFVHLVDKTDGSIDGLPEVLLQQQYLVPWLRLMRHEIEQIKDNNSDINPYGASNESEFFAVASEYFFERPDLLREKHPELYDLLLKIFSPTQNVKN